MFAGMEFGVCFTVDGGAHWVQMSGGPDDAGARHRDPEARERSRRRHVRPRGLHPRRLHGAARCDRRSAWRRRPAFPLRDAYQFDELGQVRAAWGDPATPNPPYGAVFTYHVGKPPAGDAKLVLDVSGRHRQTGAPARAVEGAGVHRIAWNLRAEAAQTAGAQGGGRGAGGGRGGQQPPPVPPGRYRATIGTLTGETVKPIGSSQLFNVVPLVR